MAILINTTRAPRAKAVIPMFNGTYTPTELLPFDGRPGSMQAAALPSRRGSMLRWPDGRLTDLAGVACEESEIAATLPTFPSRQRASNRVVDDSGKIKHTKSRAKIDENGVREIRRQNADGVAINEIARRIGLHRDTIKNIVKRETWSDVD